MPLVVLDEELRVVSASSSFHRMFSVKPEELSSSLRDCNSSFEVSRALDREIGDHRAQVNA